ncbi:tyrosine-type recombinase/integrase [Chitinibacter bivalviorum]|uniref:Tyrosine-type recombinase/integrase n=1 Tax=Chitinibacter bivalviorum TaxID=2739434 RepID=A0A7H9BK17_9NEIS|nr:tyrosine-type recombinase/integrase [Chitinibacter bivalviorum]QLG88608.1 tyrosine-type recombinase/integrase [Chitinibacter bivalviorum]
MPKKVAANQLEHLQLVNAKPSEKETYLNDGAGLWVVIHADGAKRFQYQFSVLGKRGKMWLGYFPAISLAEARQLRDEHAAIVKQGQDPRIARKIEKITQAATAATTFEAVAREWHTKKLNSWSEDHGKKIMESLVADAFPILGNMPIADINSPLVLMTIKKIEARGAVETAQRILQRIGAVMRYAMQTGRTLTDPTYKLAETLTAPKVVHRPAMPRKELPEYYRRLAAEPLHPLTKNALELLAYTFVRPGELRGAKWEEFDFEEAEWRIPAERMKMRAPHIVPLSRQALAVLDALRPHSKRSAFVFPAQTDHEKPMSENTMGYALGRMGYKDIHCPHGFRSLASTVLNEEGFDADVIERQLAHAEKNKVRAAYHRAQYLKERRALMQWWADYLDSKKPGVNVVPLNLNKVA